MDSLSKLKELCNSGNSKSLDDFLASCANSGNTQWIVDAAERGDSDAQFALSELYYHSEEEDNQTAELAFSWAMKSAQQGNSWGENNVGFCFLHGYGINQDEKLGLEWYKKSADQGNNLALCMLGKCYSDGIGTEEDDVAAFHFYLEAAEGGIPNAQYIVGCLYSEGIGTEKDYSEAIKWYEKAAANGLTDSMISLVKIYWGLEFGPDYCNYQKVVRNLENLYLQMPNDENIQYLMALVYYFGIGTGVDKNRAMSVCPFVCEILEEENKIPLEIKELGVFSFFGFYLCSLNTNFKCESPIINELFIPLIFSLKRSILNSSYANYHFLMNHRKIHFIKKIKASDFYKLINNYDKDPWDVLQFTSPNICNQLYEYLQNNQEVEFKSLIASENSDLMVRFQSYCVLKKYFSYLDNFNDLKEKNTETMYDDFSQIIEDPIHLNRLREFFVEIEDCNSPYDLIKKSEEVIIWLLIYTLRLVDSSDVESSLLNYKDYYTLKKIVEQERYKYIFDYLKKDSNEADDNDGEETQTTTEIPIKTPTDAYVSNTVIDDIEQEESLCEVHEEINQIELEEIDRLGLLYQNLLYKRKRIRDPRLYNFVCQYLQSALFADANVKEIKYIIFREGENPPKPIALTTDKKELALFITYLINRKIPKTTWVYLGHYITYKGYSVFPLDPNDDRYTTNPPTGLYTNADKNDYPNKVMNGVRKAFQRELEDKEIEELK